VKPRDYFGKTVATEKHDDGVSARPVQIPAVPRQPDEPELAIEVVRDIRHRVRARIAGPLVRDDPRRRLRRTGRVLVDHDEPLPGRQDARVELEDEPVRAG